MGHCSEPIHQITSWVDAKSGCADLEFALCLPCMQRHWKRQGQGQGHDSTSATHFVSTRRALWQQRIAATTAVSAATLTSMAVFTLAGVQNVY